jgi:hypothetical protein
MRLKKLLFASIALIVLYSIGSIMEHFGKIKISWNLFIILFIVMGFELIRKELLDLRRAMNLSLDDQDLD